MRKEWITGFSVAVAIVAISLLVALSLYLANDQSRKAEFKHALGYAHDVLHRSEQTARQIDAGIKALVAAHASEPCAEASLDHMRRIDLSSKYIQSIGHVSGSTLMCSSLGMDLADVELGEVDVHDADGVKTRIDVKFPFAPDKSFIVVERDGFAAIVHKDLPIDVTTTDQRMSLGVISRTNAMLLTGRGEIRPSWVQAVLESRGGSTFIDKDYVVAIAPSNQFDMVAMAALPLERLNANTRNTAMVLVPAAILAGLLLGFSILYLARQQLAMPSVLKAALKRGEFFVVYQPVADLRTGQWVGAEALVRWLREDDEMVPPDVFIKVAEEAGLIQQITEYVINRICIDAKDIFEKHPNFHLAINLSPADLHSENTVDLFRRLALATKAGPGNLIAEATERGFTDPDLAQNNFLKLRSCGVDISIDDFGTGYCSLSYLQSFKVDYLKIDRSFVSTIGTEAATSQVVFHIIEMAKSLNLTIVAEGVESEAQAQYLRDRGVSHAQGWLFGRHFTLADIIAKL